MWNKNTVKSIYWWMKYVKTIDSDRPLYSTYSLTVLTMGSHIVRTLKALDLYKLT